MSRILKLGTVDLDEITSMIKIGQIKTHQDLLTHIDLAIDTINIEKKRAFEMIDQIEACNEHIYTQPLTRRKGEKRVNSLSTPYIYCNKCGKLKQ